MAHSAETHWSRACVRGNCPTVRKQQIRDALPPIHHQTTPGQCFILRPCRGGGDLHKAFSGADVVPHSSWRQGGRVLWKCGLGLSLIWKNVFVAYGLNGQWATCEKKTRNMYFGVSESPSSPFNVPIWASITCIWRWESFSSKHCWPIFTLRGWHACYFGINPYLFCVIVLKSNLFVYPDYPTLLTRLFISNLLIAVIHWFS